MKQLLRQFIFTATLLATTTFCTQAQWVSIPDTNFGKWLNMRGYSQCLQGNNIVGWQMDTTCNEVITSTFIDCDNSGINDIYGIQYFDNLKFLRCAKNQIKTLPMLPISLTELSCFRNQLTSLPALPDSLNYLNCDINQLTSLPPLPSTLIRLFCNINLLTHLPNLPNSLSSLDCAFNSLTSLPTLPRSLKRLLCGSNQIEFLPVLPDTLEYLYCQNNYLLSCLPFLGVVERLDYSGTLIGCLPNYPKGNFYSNPGPPAFNVSLCDVFNSNGCDVYYNISGTLYADSIQNCTKEVSEKIFNNTKFSLYRNGILEQQNVSNNFGKYYFNTDLDTFEIRIDTTGLPYIVACPSTLFHTSILTPQDSMDTDKDFGLRCKPGFDLGVHSAIRDSGILFPAQKASIRINAGDISQVHGLNCVSGISGKVVIVYSGPVSYSGVVSGALTPAVNGKTLTYTISDFGAIDINTAFGLIFLTDTFAQIGQQLCLSISVVADVAGDINNTNNTLRICFEIVNSYDPNMKEVSPVNTIAPDEDWLTYTIHFQNMGNAPAIHIYVMDTLDSNLDESSIQILGSSHRMLTEIKGRFARFNFPNINLIDSATNEPESKGWLQYKIKKKNNLALGTQIKNTASIYFDFNAPVVTNTVTNTVTQPSAVSFPSSEGLGVGLYPNPTSNDVFITYTHNTTANVTLLNINGAACLKQQLSASNQSISLSSLPSGVYFVSVEIGGNVVRKKVVKW